MVHPNKLQDYNPLLFSIGLGFETHLENGGNIPKELLRAFKDNHISLSRDSTVSTEAKGSRWLIRDNKSKRLFTAIRKDGHLSVYDNLHVINQIVDRDLCVRCGACEPACPVDIIKFNDQAYPYITDESECITTCTRCLKVCPGEAVDFSNLDDQMFGVRPHPDSITGITKRALVSYATDDELRYRGTSGGFVTQLLIYMLDRQLIDGALVLGASAGNDNGTWQERPFIARTAEELKRAVKSKYIATPFLRPLGEMEKMEGNYAVVALPCYIHALRKYQKVSKKLRERIKLVIGLYCNVVYEPYLFDDLCEFNGIPKEDVADLHFRHGEWPGGIVGEFHDGRSKKMLKLEEMKDEFNLAKLFYTAPRCNMCVDFSAEYADIAVGDPWLRGPDGKYLFEDGRTTVLVRTEVGDQIVDMATAEGCISVKEIPLSTFMVNFESNARYKRDFVPKNIMLRRLLRLPVPEYNRPISSGKASGFFTLLLRTAILVMARFKWFRRLGLSLAQTRPAIAYFAWNRKRKEKKFAKAFPKLERFVDRLLSKRGGPEV